MVTSQETAVKAASTPETEHLTNPTPCLVIDVWQLSNAGPQPSTNIEFKVDTATRPATRPDPLARTVVWQEIAHSSPEKWMEQLGPLLRSGSPTGDSGGTRPAGSGTPTENPAPSAQ